MRTALSLLAIGLAATAAVAALTDGFHVLTSESARRRQALESPVRLPDVPLRGADGGVHPLRADLAGDGRVVLVDFFYARCETICTALGSDFQRLQRALAEQGLQARVRLLSLSFDPAHDDAAVLTDYATRLRADPARWRFATVADPRDLPRLLDAFGIVAVPDGQGGFVHNAAIHVVTPQGRLVRIRDLGALAQVLRDAEVEARRRVPANPVATR